MSGWTQPAAAIGSEFLHCPRALGHSGRGATAGLDPERPDAGHCALQRDLVERIVRAVVPERIARDALQGGQMQFVDIAGAQMLAVDP